MSYGPKHLIFTDLAWQAKLNNYENHCVRKTEEKFQKWLKLKLQNSDYLALRPKINGKDFSFSNAKKDKYDYFVFLHLSHILNLK